MTREEAIELANDMAFMACIWIDDEGNEVNDLVKLIQSAYAAGAAAEREACAKVCDDLSAHYWAKDDAIESVNCEECATAIRARGQQ